MSIVVPQLLVERRHVLLDFDGPVCAVFGGVSNHEVASALRSILGPQSSDAVADTPDPFTVLAHAAEHVPGQLAAVEAELQRLEVQAVQVAPPTPSAHEVIRRLTSERWRIAIVSNNSAVAVSTYLDAHGLTDVIRHVSARKGAEVSRMKPHAALLHDAMLELDVPPAECVLIGDSTTDVQAAHNAGTAAIGYANKPGKRERLETAGAHAVINHMRELLPD